MNPKPEISVIVPVYNQEKYLERSLTSLSNQTFKSFEVILVNDGSTDRSEIIIKKICNIKSNFKYIKKDNAGVASARQKGLEEAKGKYIIHVDPDDWVEEDFLELLYAEAVNSNADMVVCDYWEEYSSQKIQKGIIGKRSFDETEIDQFKLMIINGKIWGTCWNKLIKASCIKGNVSFEPDIDFQEDKLFIYRSLAHIKRVSIINNPLYHYNRDNNSSAIRTIKKKELLQLWKIKKIILKEENNSILREKFIDIFTSYKTLDLLLSCKELSRKEYKNIIRPYFGVIRRSNLNKIFNFSGNLMEKYKGIRILLSLL